LRWWRDHVPAVAAKVESRQATSEVADRAARVLEVQVSATTSRGFPRHWKLGETSLTVGTVDIEHDHATDHAGDHADVGVREIGPPLRDFRFSRKSFLELTPANQRPFTGGASAVIGQHARDVHGNDAEPQSAQALSFSE